MRKKLTKEDWEKMRQGLREKLHPANLDIVIARQVELGDEQFIDPKEEERAVTKAIKRLVKKRHVCLRCGKAWRDEQAAKDCCGGSARERLERAHDSAPESIPEHQVVGYVTTVVFEQGRFAGEGGQILLDISIPLGFDIENIDWLYSGTPVEITPRRER